MIDEILLTEMPKVLIMQEKKPSMMLSHRKSSVSGRRWRMFFRVVPLNRKTKKGTFKTRVIGLLSIALLMASASAQAGTIYVSTSRKSSIQVMFVNTKAEADLCVYVAETKSQAKGKDEIWYYGKSKWSADAIVYFVSSKSQADIKVFVVSSKSQAGWRTPNRYQGQLK